jgi:hypothetical protein
LAIRTNLHIQWIKELFETFKLERPHEVSQDLLNG